MIFGKWDERAARTEPRPAVVTTATAIPNGELKKTAPVAVERPAD
jgi:hypothetical protein